MVWLELRIKLIVRTHEFTLWRSHILFIWFTLYSIVYLIRRNKYSNRLNNMEYFFIKVRMYLFRRLNSMTFLFLKKMLQFHSVWYRKNLWHALIKILILCTPFYYIRFLLKLLNVLFFENDHSKCILTVSSK